MGEMKPCPFCRSESVALDAAENPAGLRWVRCLVCEAEGPPMLNEADAMRAWNDRLIDAPNQETVERFFAETRDERRFLDAHPNKGEAGQ